MVQLPTHPKPGGELDLEAVDRFSIGFNSSVEDNELEVSDFLVVPR